MIHGNNHTTRTTIPATGERMPQADGQSRHPSAWHLFLAALPHVLTGLLVSLQPLGILKSVLPDGSPLVVPAVILLWLVISGGSVWVLVTARKASWPGWWGAWVTYLALAGFAGLIALIQFFSADDWLNRYNLFVFVIAGAVAYGLYRVTRHDALHGLLAGLTVVTCTGFQALEFVPAELRAIITGWAWLLLAIFSMLVLKAGELRWRLPLSLLGGLLILMPFAWVGIYHGGMLNFDAPGASWVQVLRAGLPMFSQAGCLLLGPQLARLVRQIEISKRAPRAWRYRSVLLGEAALLMAAVIIFWQHTSAYSMGFYPVGWGLLVTGFILTSLGMGMVFRGSEQYPGLTRAIGFSLALLGLPWALLTSLPGPLEYAARTTGVFPLALAHYPEFGLHLSALLWVVLTPGIILSAEQLLSSRVERADPYQAEAGLK